MITEALLGILATIIGWVTEALPEWTVELPDGAELFLGAVRSVNWLLPITEIFNCLGLYMALLVAMNIWKWTIKLVDWIADVIP